MRLLLLAPRAIAHARWPVLPATTHALSVARHAAAAARAAAPSPCLRRRPTTRTRGLARVQRPGEGLVRAAGLVGRRRSTHVLHRRGGGRGERACAAHETHLHTRIKPNCECEWGRGI